MLKSADIAIDESGNMRVLWQKWQVTFQINKDKNSWFKMYVNWDMNMIDDDGKFASALTPTPPPEINIKTLLHTNKILTVLKFGDLSLYLPS